jgi:hypothetical protein
VNISHTAALNNNSGFVAFIVEMSLEHCVAHGNIQAGMQVSVGSTIRVSDSVATNNGFGFNNLNGGAFLSRSAGNNMAAPGTNTVSGNWTNIAGTITYYNGN